MFIACALSALSLAACNPHHSTTTSNDMVGTDGVATGHLYPQECSQEFVRDYREVSRQCRENGYRSAECDQANQEFHYRYSNMQCSYDNGRLRIDYSDLNYQN